MVYSVIMSCQFKDCVFFLLNSMGGFLTIKSAIIALVDLIKTQNSASKIF